MGAEFIYVQQHDDDEGRCSEPGKVGARADVDYDLSGTQVVSGGTQILTGQCSDRGLTTKEYDLELKGTFTMMF